MHVVIVHYENSEDLARCLSSLTSALIVSITVIDNGSSSAEANFARLVSENTPGASYLGLDTNVGFGAGINLAIAAIDAPDDDFVWILNPDTVTDDNAVEAMHRALNNLDARDIVSPTLYSGDETQVWFGGGRFHRLAGFTRHFHSAPRGQYREVNFLTGAAMMMRLGRWRELGGFRESLFLYWEDTDLCIRASKAGSRLFVVRDARVWHRTGGSSRRGTHNGKSRVWYYFLARNRLVVCAPYRFRSPMFFMTGLSASLGLALRALREADDPLAKLAWLARGSWDGLSAQNDAQLGMLTERRATELGLHHQAQTSPPELPRRAAPVEVERVHLVDSASSE